MNQPKAQAQSITPRAEDYSRWYADCIAQAELAEHAPVKGCMVIRPHGYAVWELLQRQLDDRFKALGVKNAYFPMFIPQSFLQKEKDHVEGFSPETAVVTHGGGAELEEPLIVRPTSETIINHLFAKWIQSHRDLPMLINQWCNVVRWEMRPRLFLRTTEFLWQEGHTAHVTEAEAVAFAKQMLEVYRSFVEEVLAVPVIAGVKSQNERFAGAVDSYAIEAMMQDTRALQCGTSHFLGQTFSKAFGTRFQTESKGLEYAWQTSWGVSTRLIGAVIMTHGDDSGVVFPPRVAPIQVAIVPIWRSDEEKGQVLEAADKVKSALGGIRCEIDDRDGMKPGRKYFHWEVRGVPVRLEIGPRDVAAGHVMSVRRDNREKKPLPMEGIADAVADLLDAVQEGLLEKARDFLDDHTFAPDSYDAFKERMAGEGGFARAPWCGKSDCEAAIKTETKATTRVLVGPVADGAPCFRCGEPGASIAIVARNY